MGFAFLSIVRCSRRCFAAETDDDDDENTDHIQCNQSVRGRSVMLSRCSEQLCRLGVQPSRSGLSSVCSPHSRDALVLYPPTRWPNVYDNVAYLGFFCILIADHFSGPGREVGDSVCLFLENNFEAK